MIPKKHAPGIDPGVETGIRKKIVHMEFGKRARSIALRSWRITVAISAAY
jgi:hypothetical protein